MCELAEKYGVAKASNAIAWIITHLAFMKVNTGTIIHSTLPK